MGEAGCRVWSSNLGQFCLTHHCERGGEACVRAATKGGRRTTDLNTLFGADTITYKVEQYVRLNVRKPRWMPWLVFRWLMRMIVIEETPLRFTLDNTQNTQSGEQSG